MTKNDPLLDAIVVGNVGIDTSIFYVDDLSHSSLETNFTSNLDNVGQSGGYAARGFAQLGFRTGFIGSIGDDYLGDHIREQFTRDGIDLSGVFIDPVGTNRSVNLMRHDGTRTSFYDGKGNQDLQPDLARSKSVLARGKIAHFSIPNWARQILPIARDLGLTVTCDLQDIVDLDDPYRQDFIQGADILFFSSVNQVSPEEIMTGILEQDQEKIIISGMGAEGCALATHAGIQYFPPVQMDREILDANGAGDSLAVGFLSGYCLEGKSLEEAVLWGQIAARYACSVKADSSKLITKEELVEYLQKG